MMSWRNWIWLGPVLILWALFASNYNIAQSVRAHEFTPTWRATLVSCYDGDTCRFDIELWPEFILQTLVRLRGIDAPEISGKCPTEQVLAQAAREFLFEQLQAAESIVITRVEEDKYGGRVVATVLADGHNVSILLLEKGLARPYEGGKRQSWCER